MTICDKARLNVCSCMCLRFTISWSLWHPPMPASLPHQIHHRHHRRHHHRRLHRHRHRHHHPTPPHQVRSVAFEYISSVHVVILIQQLRSVLLQRIGISCVGCIAWKGKENVIKHSPNAYGRKAGLGQCMNNEESSTASARWLSWKHGRLRLSSTEGILLSHVMYRLLAGSQNCRLEKCMRIYPQTSQCTAATVASRTPVSNSPTGA